MPDNTPYHGLVAWTRTAPCTGKVRDYQERPDPEQSSGLPCRTHHEIEKLVHCHLKDVKGIQDIHAETQLSGFIRVCRVLDVIERFELLVPEPVPSPVAQLKLAGRKRQRASTANPNKPTGTKWQWGPEK